jgi:hypothetical protein
MIYGILKSTTCVLILILILRSSTYLFKQLRNCGSTNKKKHQFYNFYELKCSFTVSLTNEGSAMRKTIAMTSGGRGSREG